MDVARQSLITAEAEHRQQAQIALFDAKSKARLADLQGAIEGRRANYATTTTTPWAALPYLI
jgi:hypothetical protein